MTKYNQCNGGCGRLCEDADFCEVTYCSVAHGFEPEPRYNQRFETTYVEAGQYQNGVIPKQHDVIVTATIDTNSRGYRDIYLTAESFGMSKTITIDTDDLLGPHIVEFIRDWFGTHNQIPIASRLIDEDE